MSEQPKEEAKPKDAKEAKGKGGGGGLAILGILLPALLAGGAAYGGVRAAAKGLHAEGGGHEEPAHHEQKPPGPTVALEPFLVAVQDGNHKGHPMKLTLAVEFEATAKEEEIKAFMPRMRDAILAHVRSMSFEDAVDSQHNEKLRTELLEKCRGVGATAAQRILITDLVTQ